MFRKVLIFGIVFLGITALNLPAIAADKYDIDPAHSTLGFAIKHLKVSTVRGVFTNYSGAIEFDPNDLSSFKTEVTIQANSIDTKNEQRDNHLKSADFFDVEKFPTITFTNAKLEKQADGVVIVGDLMMKGVTKSITIPVEVSGPVKGMQGDDVIGIAGEGMINRQDFGISWSKALDSGGLVVDDTVRLVVEIEAHKK